MNDTIHNTQHNTTDKTLQEEHDMKAAGACPQHISLPPPHARAILSYVNPQMADEQRTSSTMHALDET